jgi:hypothetical protein
MSVQKLYFPVSSTLQQVKFDSTTRQISVPLPDAFTSASGPRWIHLRHARVLHYQGLPGDIKVHSNIVVLSPYDDSFACFANEVLVKPKKFAYNTSQKILYFWFKDMLGEYVNADAWVIELLLEWTI